jgi:hypothetical protein
MALIRNTQQTNYGFEEEATDGAMSGRLSREAAGSVVS